VSQAGTKPQSQFTSQREVDELALPQLSNQPMPNMFVQSLSLLWNRRRLLIRAAGIGLLLGALLAFSLPNRYESTVQLMPPDSQSSSSLAMMAALTAKAGTGMSSVAGDLLGLKSSGALFIGILRSRTVADRMIQRFDLKKVYWIRRDEDARRKLAERTAVSEDRKSGILTITATDTNPERAAAIAHAYVEELDRLAAQVSTSSARREREFLEERLKTVQLDLENAEQEFSKFASKSGAIDIKEQGRAMVEAAAALEGQLIAAKSQLEGLKQIYTDNNVRVRSTQARVTELQSQLKKMSGKSETNTAPQTEETEAMYPSIRKLPLLGVTYADLYRRSKVQETVFEALTQQFELAKVEEAKETPSVRVLDDAHIPETKSFPPRLIIIFLCTGMALAGAAIFVIAQSRWVKLDSADPGKILVRDVVHSVQAGMPWAPPNGSRVQAMTHRMWLKIARRSDSAVDSDNTQK
jgi:uncharacterized protein involved in exopolysaccharide biosynthesis